MKITREHLDAAEKFARVSHAGQKRRDGVTDYIKHPEAVAAGLFARGASFEVCAVAWLHDVLEDTDATHESMARSGIPHDIIHAVSVLTKRHGQEYRDYLCCVNRNAVARQVKIADMLHNLSDKPTDRQIVKYCRGLLFLMGAAP